MRRNCQAEVRSRVTGRWMNHHREIEQWLEAELHAAAGLIRDNTDT
jgi:hypothetical protein